MLDNNLRLIAKGNRRKSRRGRVTREQRERWAAAIRAPMLAHPKQWAATQSTAKLKAIPAARRSGKTEGIGREETAQLIENDDLLTWVFSDTVKSFDRNWVSKGIRPDGGTSDDGKVGMIRLLNELGVPYRLSSDRPISSVTFPWGSQMVILPAADRGKLEDARGGLFDRLWIDEAQSMDLLTEILGTIAGPASMDQDAVITLSGTPGPEVGSFFHRVVSGDVQGWEVHDMTTADNPHFGATWSERWATVLERGPRKLRDVLRLSDEQLDRMAALDESGFSVSALSSQRWVSELPEDVQREWLRLWVADSASLVYPSAHIDDAVRHWADWAPYPTAAAYGHNVIAADLKRQTSAWAARFALLPKQHTVGGKLVPRLWRALLGVDLASHPDAFVVTLQLFGGGILYEFDTGKAHRLRDDEQLDVVHHWITAVASMPHVSLWGVVVDADGGNTPAQINGWRHRLAPLLPTTGIIRAHKPDRDMQIRLLNAERSAGRVRTLRNGPIHIEEDHLQREPWDPEHPTRKRGEAKHRLVHVDVRDDLGRRTQIELMPGNDAIDARRYPWYWATHTQEALATDEEPRAPITGHTAQIEHFATPLHRRR